MTTTTKPRATATLPPITVTLNVDRGIIRDTLITAWEQGAGYWITDTSAHAPPEAELIAHAPSGRVYPGVDYPLSRGGHCRCPASPTRSRPTWPPRGPR